MSKNLYPIKLYLKYKPNLIFVLSSFIVNVATWLWLLWHIGPREDHIFLHYNVLFGVDLIGPWQHMLYLPGLGLLILLVNALVGWLFFRDDKFVSTIFNGISLICQLVILVVAQLIILLNV